MDKGRITHKLKFLKNKYIILLSRLILGLIFIDASIDKIIDPSAFSDIIDNYHVTPLILNNLIALVIPWIELIIGICLITGIFLDGAVLISFVLLILFIFMISQALLRGIDLNCGCFDLSQKNMNDINIKLEMYKRLFEDFLYLVMVFIINNRNKK